MRYEDLERARTERAAKEAEKEVANEVRRVEKAMKGSNATLTAKKATTGKAKRGRKRKSSLEIDALERKANTVQTSPKQAEEFRNASMFIK